MYLAPENIDNHLRNELFWLGVHSTIDFTAKWTYAARDNIEDYGSNEFL